MIEKKITQIFCMHGNKEHAKEIKEVFDSSDAAFPVTWKFDDENNLYFLSGNYVNLVRKGEALYNLLIDTQNIYELSQKDDITLVDGEVYVNAKGDIFIYDGNNNKSYLSVGVKCVLRCDGALNMDAGNGYFATAKSIGLSPAIPKQKQRLFDALTEEGYFYNLETKKIEKIKEVVEFYLTLTEPCLERELYTVNDHTHGIWELSWVTSIIVADTHQYIPYNKETEKLINTTNEPEKEYKLMGVKTFFE